LAAGLFRPITLWPFPSDDLAARAPNLRALLVVELSAGQMVEDVRLAVEGRVPVFFDGRMGGMVPTPDEVLGALRHAYAMTGPRRRSVEHAPWDDADADPMGLISDAEWLRFLAALKSVEGDRR
jgi:pyruvate/2-oxoacid:ferredoxin oxidoreductase alpha subunit